MAGFDINQIKGNDRFIAGGAVLILILSFFPWYAISSSGIPGIRGTSTGSNSSSVNMWHAYGWNKTATFLVLIAGAIVIARLMGALDAVKLPAGVNLITLAVSALASVIYVLRFLFAFKSQHIVTVKISEHPSFGWYLTIVVSLAMTYFTFLNFKASGEELPSKPSTTPPATP